MRSFAHVTTAIALLASAACCFSSTAANAQIRVDPQAAYYADPTTGQEARELFGRSGLFMIAGGVVLGGRANFYLEHNGVDQLVPANAVQVQTASDGTVSLVYAGANYTMAMPHGLACPLSQFVVRDGIIAYTIPKYLDENSRGNLMRAGLRHHRIAYEFDGTPFESLLRAADFADTTQLPEEIGRSLTASLNEANGLSNFSINASSETASKPPIGSLINTDVQVRYHVYLLADKHTVEISGVPLRYYWELDQSGAAGVFAVDVFAQNWPSGTTLTQFATQNTKPTQYDIINFYQVSGVFHQLHDTNAEQFSDFSAQACRAGV